MKSGFQIHLCLFILGKHLLFNSRQKCFHCLIYPHCSPRKEKCLLSRFTEGAGMCPSHPSGQLAGLVPAFTVAPHVTASLYLLL